jgi:multidrug transporter EmrE-like cation transporter
MSGWIYVILCASCSVLIAHFLKVAETKGLNTVRVLTVNYLIATVVAFFTSGFNAAEGFDFSGGTGPLFLAAFTGFIFIANFFIYSKSVFHNGVGISIAAMRISLILPVLLSTLWYLELLTFPQWLGVSLVFVTLWLLLPNKRKMLREPFSAAWLLVLLFLGTGIGDSSLKVYESEFSSVLGKEQFMGFVFLTAFLIGIFVVAVRKNWKFTGKELMLGTAIGIPNLYSAIFLIEALERMPGGVVYSSVNVLTVLGGTILGLALWGDKLTKLQWAGILFTLVSILLLI